jgi:hypothetical protein
MDRAVQRAEFDGFLAVAVDDGGGEAVIFFIAHDRS